MLGGWPEVRLHVVFSGQQGTCPTEVALTMSPCHARVTLAARGTLKQLIKWLASAVHRQDKLSKAIPFKCGTDLKEDALTQQVLVRIFHHNSA